MLISLKDYFEELTLMERQYGGEEELYPFINFLLRKGKNVENISIRTVANGRKAKKVVGRDLISGCISFPDIALLKKEFDKERDFDVNKENILGCVEAKKMSHNVLDDIKGDIDIELIKRKVIIAKPSKKPRYYCETVMDCDNQNTTECKVLEAKRLGELDEINVKQLREKFHIDFEKDKWKLININNCENAKEFYENIEKNNFLVVCEERIYLNGGIQLTNWYKNNNEYKEGVTDEGQIFGELFWYGKVLYTNGLVWKYLEVTKCGEKYTGNEARLYLRKQIYDNCIKGDKKWYEIINDKKVKIKCADIADLTKGYNTYKDNKELTSDHIKQWDDLINGLADIKWLPQSEQTKED